jgi:hypothetical protein
MPIGFPRVPLITFTSVAQKIDSKQEIYVAECEEHTERNKLLELGI